MRRNRYPGRRWDALAGLPGFDDFLVEADLPGVRPDDVTIDLQGKDLRLGGEYGGGRSRSYP
ncbi:MAG TPA: Hsp20/alpha crystallin family protein [Pseudonocardiaceae bacterium]|nr:Hsp20/alpha crystallin family protein [Pseudonocardiaceae bacterium]